MSPNGSDNGRRWNPIAAVFVWTLALAACLAALFWGPDLLRALLALIPAW